MLGDVNGDDNLDVAAVNWSLPGLAVLVTAATAPGNTTVVTEVASISGPATRFPTGTVPPKAIIHSAITRPRSFPARCSCSTVDSAVTVAK